MEVKLTREKSVRKVKIPPITCFGIKPADLHEAMKALAVVKYNIKLLRNEALQLNCESIDDFRKVSVELAKDNREYYTHDLPGDRMMKFVLKGLGNDYNATDVEQELKAININPTAVKILNEASKYYTFIVSFKKGEMNLTKLKEIRFVLNTSIKWESYRNKHKGITTCSRCQRPGHGQRHCNMKFRCELCGENHDTKVCPSNEEIKRKLSEINDPKAEKNVVQLEIPGKCCNCNVNGHFASDPNCPSKRKYIEKRTKKSKESRTNSRQHFKLDPVAFPSINGSNDDKHHVAPAVATVINGVSYAQRTKVFPSNPTPPVGNNPFNLKFSYDNLNSGGNSTFTNTTGINPLFSVEETLQLLEEIRTKLPDVTKTPLNVAVPILMQIAIKYLYGYNDGCK